MTKTFKVYYEGTVTGVVEIDATSLEKAIKIANKTEKGIDIKFYPEDWKIDEELTKELNKEN